MTNPVIRLQFWCIALVMLALFWCSMLMLAVHLALEHPRARAWERVVLTHLEKHSHLQRHGDQHAPASA